MYEEPDYIKVPKKHDVIIEEKNEYYTTVCSCGWSSGPWAGYRNAAHDAYKHEQFVKDLIKLYGSKQ